MAGDREFVRALADNFLYDGVARPEPLPEPYRTIWDRTEEALARTTTVSEAVRYACRGLPDAEALEPALVLRMQSEGEYESLAETAQSMEPVRWLWPAWIPRGMVTMLGGHCGSGKSDVALDLVRRIMQGGTWPDGQPLETGVRRCLYVCAGETPAVEDASDLDKEHFHLMLPSAGRGFSDLRDEEQQGRLADLCGVLQPELVVVDRLPLGGGREETTLQDQRLLYQFLWSVAGRHQCGLLLIHDVPRRGAVARMGVFELEDYEEALHLFMMAPSVMALSAVRRGSGGWSGRRRLEVVKTNLARLPKALELTLVAGRPAVPHYGEPPKMYRRP